FDPGLRDVSPCLREGDSDPALLGLQGSRDFSTSAIDLPGAGSELTPRSHLAPMLSASRWWWATPQDTFFPPWPSRRHFGIARTIRTRCSFARQASARSSPLAMGSGIESCRVPRLRACDSPRGFALWAERWLASPKPGER